jgi:HPt (histidine-containing phosphotransfer) domain-containing protein
MAILHYSIGTGKSGEVDRIAHKLAGSCSVCGVKAVIPPLKELEERGKTGRLDGAGQLFDQIDRLLKLSQIALDDYIGELKRGAQTY